MNICIDVGNTTVAIGLFKENKLVDKFVYDTDSHESSADFYSLLIEVKNKIAFLNIREVKNIIYASVVPHMNNAFKEAIFKTFKQKALTIKEDFDFIFPTKVNCSYCEIGDDLIADLIAAKEKYGYPLLIADLGTASKILFIDKDGAFSSSVFMPGLTLSAHALSKNAALLPDVDLKLPKSVQGKDTLSSMQAGILFGHIDMIEGLFERFEKENDITCKHILTGGHAYLLKDGFSSEIIYDKDLILDGLNILLNKNLRK